MCGASERGAGAGAPSLGRTPTWTEGRPEASPWRGCRFRRSPRHDAGPAARNGWGRRAPAGCTCSAFAFRCKWGCKGGRRGMRDVEVGWSSTLPTHFPPRKRRVLAHACGRRKVLCTDARTSPSQQPLSRWKVDGSRGGTTRVKVGSLPPAPPFTPACTESREGDLQRGQNAPMSVLTTGRAVSCCVHGLPNELPVDRWGEFSTVVFKQGTRVSRVKLTYFFLRVNPPSRIRSIIWPEEVPLR